MVKFYNILIILGCSKNGNNRAHVHVNGRNMTSLIMLCSEHNNPHFNEEFKIQKNIGVVDIPNCDCCTCGCNGSKYYNNNVERSNNSDDGIGFIGICLLIILCLPILIIYLCVKNSGKTRNDRYEQV